MAKGKKDEEDKKWGMDDIKNFLGKSEPERAKEIQDSGVFDQIKKIDLMPSLTKRLDKKKSREHTLETLDEVRVGEFDGLPEMNLMPLLTKKSGKKKSKKNAKK